MLKVFFWRFCEAWREVQVWPEAGTYWRGSWGLLVVGDIGIDVSQVCDTYIADATVSGWSGEWDVELGAACFADG